jgi:hypothetical protein
VGVFGRSLPLPLLICFVITKSVSARKPRLFDRRAATPLSSLPRPRVEFSSLWKVLLYQNSSRLLCECKTTRQYLPGVSRYGKCLALVLCVLLDTSLVLSQKIQYRMPANSSPAMLSTSDQSHDEVPASFYEVLRKALKKRKTNLERICPISDPVARRILEDYGAMFLATKKVTPPPVCIFTSEAEVTKFQEEADYVTQNIEGGDIQLQAEAMKQLLKAREQALKEGLNITPRDGAEGARRSYDDSYQLWNTRFLPALDYWQQQGRLTDEQVARLKTLPLHQQVAEVLGLERGGIYFSKDLSKSILYSIAAPGTSQHIAMLALDVNEFDNVRVRELLAEHGWFQTVLSDSPHFTFLGLKEKDLPKNGLKSVEVDGQIFWIPNVTDQPNKT